MANELYVLNEGVNIPSNFTATLSATSYNTNVPISPRLVTKSSGSGAAYLNCYEIHDSDVIGTSALMAYSSVGSSLLNRLYPKSTTVADYGTNLLETPGHRIVIDLSIEGYESSSLVLTNTTLESDDYFVVINADNAKMHHVGICI